MLMLLAVTVYQLAMQTDDRPEWVQLCTVTATRDGEESSMRCIWFSGEEPDAWMP